MLSPRTAAQSLSTVVDAIPTMIAGLGKGTLAREGVSCQQAFDGLVSFVNCKTHPGQKSAIVAHNGFAFHFPIMEAAVLRSAAAASACQFAAATAAAATPTAIQAGAGEENLNP
jgi:hypothetical protein